MGLFVGVQGVTSLIKSVTGQVLAGWPSHVVGRPLSVSSTDFKPRVPFYWLLESVTAKESHGRLQSGADRPGSLVSQPPIGPTCQWPLHMASSYQVHFRGDTYFGRIPHFLVIS
jgi:hypothetical protein